MWGVIFGLLVIGFLTFLFFLLYHISSRASCQSDADLTGKTVLITGGNTGIGYETALNLARRNARVVVACRDPARADDAVQKLRKITGNGQVTSMTLDLSSLDSVRQFAEEFKVKEGRLDILINNAGIIGSTSKRTTKDGLELTMAVNHFGHFLLTNLLLDRLKKSAPSRVVVLTSVVQFWGKIEFSNLNAERSYFGGPAYFNSKLANVLFAKELHRRYNDQGISVFAVHPGSVRTQLLRSLIAPLKIFFDYLIMPLFFMTPEQGSQTSVYCAVQPGIEPFSGKYFTNCRMEDEGAGAKDKEVAVKLWEISETITGLA